MPGAVHKPSLEGMAHLLEELAADLALRHQRIRDHLQAVRNGTAQPPERWVVDRDGTKKNIVDVEQWRRSTVSTLERSQDHLWKRCMDFMKQRVAYLKAEKEAAKSLDRDAYKEALVTFFLGELSETEQKDLLLRLQGKRAA